MIAAPYSTIARWFPPATPALISALIKSGSSSEKPMLVRMLIPAAIVMYGLERINPSSRRRR
jgi:hypothetical protein